VADGQDDDQRIYSYTQDFEMDAHGSDHWMNVTGFSP